MRGEDGEGENVCKRKTRKEIRGNAEGRQKEKEWTGAFQLSFNYAANVLLDNKQQLDSKTMFRCSVLTKLSMNVHRVFYHPLFSFLINSHVTYRQCLT